MLFVLATLLLIASYSDIKTRKIPNILILAGIVAGLSLQFILNGTEGLINGLQGLGIGFAIMLPMYIFFKMGAGDVKLVATVGAFLGFPVTIDAVVYILCTGIIIGLSLIIIKGGLFQMLRRYGTMLMLFRAKQFSYIEPVKDEAAGISFPYAVAITIGTVVAVITTL